MRRRGAIASRSAQQMLVVGPFMLASPFMSSAQLVINQSQPPATLVQNVLLGPSVFASNVTFNGQQGNLMPIPAAHAERIARFNGTNCNIGLPGGVLLTNATAAAALGPNNNTYFGAGTPTLTGDPDLHLLTGYPFPFNLVPDHTRDIAVLEFDFIPASDMIRFRYVFASEEYPEGTCLENANDVFGFFLSGPGISGPFSNGAINLALVPNTLTPISINTVNSGMVAENANGPVMNPFQGCFNADPDWAANSVYYIHNGSGTAGDTPYCCDPYHVQYNGFTVVLEATAAVQCGQQYHIKLGIADTHSHYGPSAVFLEQGSFTSEDRFGLTVAPGPNVEFTATDTIFIESGCDSVHLRFHRHGGHYLDEWLRITTGGDATAGVDYLPQLPDSIHFAQLDTMVVVPIAVPVDGDGIEELVVNLITCNGLKIQTYVFLIDQRPPLEVELEEVHLTCPGSVTLTPEVSGGSGDPSGWTHLWNTGETTPSITVEVEQATQFWVTVSDSCWTFPVTDGAWVYLPAYDTLNVSVPPDTAVACLGTAVIEAVAAGGAGGYTYAWTADGAVVGTTAAIIVPASNGTVYTVEVTDQCGQAVTGTVVVTTGPTPPIVIEAYGDTVLCAGMEAVLQVVTVSGGGGTYRYDWNLGPGGPNSPTLTVTADGNAYYTVTVTDECGNVADTTLAVIVPDHPPLLITASGDMIVCPGEPVVLWVEVEGGAGGYGVTWPGIGTGNPLTWTAVHPGIDAIVEVVDACGVMATGNVSIGVHAASVEIDPHQDADLTWTFTAITDPPTGNELEWDLGDGTSATSTTITHTYSEPNAYWVILYMTTPEGCVAVDSVRTRPPSATIYFPNTFTPNGDGYNDTFGGEGVLIDGYELLVFDRWGRVLFESHDLTHRWNGRFPDGEEVPDGVYQYKYRAKGLDMPLHQRFGHVTLLR